MTPQGREAQIERPTHLLREYIRLYATVFAMYLGLNWPAMSLLLESMCVSFGYNGTRMLWPVPRSLESLACSLGAA